MRENVFEFYKDESRMSVTLSQGRYISRFKELAERFPEEIDYLINEDGTLFGHMPVSFLRLNPPHMLSDEEKLKRAEKLREIRSRRNS